MKFAPEVLDILVGIVWPIHLPVPLLDSCHALRLDIKMNQLMLLFNGPVVFFVEVVDIVALLGWPMHFFDVPETL